MSQCIVRAATTADVHDMASLKQRAESASMPFKTFRRTFTQEVGYIAKTLGRYSVFVATTEGIPVGFIAHNTLWVEQIFVDPPWYRKGVGSLLLSEAKRTMQRIMVSVIKENRQARNFYEKEGFVLVGDIPESNAVKYAWSSLKEQASLKAGG